MTSDMTWTHIEVERARDLLIPIWRATLVAKERPSPDGDYVQLEQRFGPFEARSKKRAIAKARRHAEGERVEPDVEIVPLRPADLDVDPNR